MTISEAYQDLKTSLKDLYGDREAGNIADMVIEKLTGFSKSARLMHKEESLTPSATLNYENFKKRLVDFEPVQYVIEESWFYGEKFYVNNHVLIPRPETEELVALVEKRMAEKIHISVIDIGTGSGCIPVILKKRNPALQIEAVDISEAALAVAKKNAENLEANIVLKQVDILDEKQWSILENYDIIISNPPYITKDEITEMRANVLQEPHVALFVNKDALEFYEAIGEFALKHLNKNGMLFFEINEAYGKEVKNLLEAKGYQNVEIVKDMMGKERMITGSK